MEAPHLSQITEQYKKDGLVVLAVNSRDDPKDGIEQFVNEHKLQQRILLNGRDVKENVYGMKGIPMLFWIDRAGVVVNTHLDYDEASAKLLDEYTLELVGKRVKPD